MEKETLEKAERLSAQIKGIKEYLEIVKELKSLISAGYKPKLSVQTAYHFLFIPVPTGLRYLHDAELRLKKEINDFEKELKEL